MPTAPSTEPMIGLSIMGSVLGAVGIMSQGTPEQVGEWLPQCFGSEGDVRISAGATGKP